MRFIMAYSGGKDCTLALDRMIRAGHECVAMVVLANLHGASFNHALPADVLRQYEQCFEIPLEMVRAPRSHDFEPLRASLSELQERYRPDAVCFGDLFLDSSRRTNTQFAEAIGAQALFPLWGDNPYQMFEELNMRGYRIMVKSIDTKLLPESLLGQTIGGECLRIFEDAGIDISGEYGEYHTLALDGPLFRKPLEFETVGTYHDGSFATMRIRSANRKTM